MLKIFWKGLLILLIISLIAGNGILLGWILNEFKLNGGVIVWGCIITGMEQMIYSFTITKITFAKCVEMKTVIYWILYILETITYISIFNGVSFAIGYGISKSSWSFFVGVGITFILALLVWLMRACGRNEEEDEEPV